MFPHRCLAVAFALALGLSAQHVLVASRGTAPATVLLDVDLANGSFVTLGRFISDTVPPRAVAVDPVNRDAIVALDFGLTTRIVRVHRHRGAVVGQRVLGDVFGPVTRLAFGNSEFLFATVAGTAGGLFRIPRNGGTPVLVATLPDATALLPWGHHSTQAVIGQSGSPGFDPRIRIVDLVTCQDVSGPHSFPNYTPLGITGIADLPTALIRYVLGHDDGTVALSVNFATPTAIPLTPTLPAGGTRSLRGTGLDVLALGGASHPFLTSFTAFPPSAAWTMRSNALPGDPVDFDFDPGPGPDVVSFGLPCSMLSLNGTGEPRLGNASFGLSLAAGVVQQPALLVLGVSDQMFAPLPLPVPLPFSTCPLRVSAELAVSRTTDSLGRASWPLPVPNDPSLHAAILFAQVVQAQGTALVASQGVALHLAQ